MTSIVFLFLFATGDLGSGDESERVDFAKERERDDFAREWEREDFARERERDDFSKIRGDDSAFSNEMEGRISLRFDYLGQIAINFYHLGGTVYSEKKG